MLAALPQASAQTCIVATTEAADAAARQIIDVGVKRVAAYPRGPIRTTSAQRKRWDTGSWPEWTSGFEAASTWLVYGATGDPKWRRRAQRESGHLSRAARSTSHDVGFMVGYPARLAFQLTGSGKWRRLEAQAARSLNRHWVPGAQVYWSWPARNARVIPDSLPNMALMWGRHDGRAAQHVRTVIRTHMRADGSTFHVRDLSRRDGRVLGTPAGQGWRAGSTWTRGQAWTMLGLAQASAATGDPRISAAAAKATNWWLRNLPSSCVPWSDADGPRTVRDTSAAAIGAAALQQLPGREDAANAALVTLAGAMSKRGPALMQAGALRWTASGAREWLPYADYFALEAAARHLKLPPFN